MRVFFMKPCTGTRACDILGMDGPNPTQTPIFVSKNQIMYTCLDDLSKEQNYLFSLAGKFIGKVSNPMEEIKTQFGIERKEI
jgi:hypothetical protein